MRSKKKFMLFIAVLSAIVCCSLFMTACNKDKQKGPDDPPPASTLELSVNEATLMFGETLKIIPSYTIEDGKTLAWSSGNTSVATVEDGLVSAVGAGTADITATYGDLTAKCTVTVSFGNYQPELYLENVYGNSLRIGKNSSFALGGYVAFNGMRFPCDLTAEISDGAVAKYEDGVMKGIGIGSTVCTVKTEWNSFSGAMLQKELDIEVFNDVSISAVVTGRSGTFVGDTLELSVTPSWQEKEYDNEVAVEIVAYENGTKKTLNNARLVQEGNAVSYAGGRLTALTEGTAALKADYTDSLGKNYTFTLNVSVECPMADYDGTLELCTEDAFPVETLFGTGATLISASSNGTALDITGGKIGIEAKGENTASFSVKTSKGGYRFSSVYAYTKKIMNASDFASALTLTNGKTIGGYYILGGDVNGVTVSDQYPGNANTYFDGVFDGCGHTLKATVGANGLFGAFGNGATVKDTRFELTFPSSGQACGLAKNQGTFNQTATGTDVTLKNISVITTNYTNESYCLMINKPDRLSMEDVYVKINGNSALGAFSDVATNRAALFGVDQSVIDIGGSHQFNGAVRRVYVVTETFVPMANGLNWSGAHRYVSYAYNDAEKLGTFVRENDSTGAVTYMNIKDGNEAGSEKSKLFGSSASLNYVTFLYVSHFNYKDGGVARYDTAEQLRASGVTTVGSWNVE